MACTKCRYDSTSLKRALSTKTKALPFYSIIKIHALLPGHSAISITMLVDTALHSETCHALLKILFRHLYKRNIELNMRGSELETHSRGRKQSAIKSSIMFLKDSFGSNIGVRIPKLKKKNVCSA